MKKTLLITVALIWAAATLPLSPARAIDHVTYKHKEGDFCGPPCGAEQCYDAKNEVWVCKATKTGDATSCKWHTTGVCDNNVKAGEDINKNAEQARKAADDRRKANEKRAADEKKADDKKATDDKKKADEKKAADDKKKADDKKAADDKKKADEKKAKDNKK
jgi:hypothetical protein